MRGTPEPKPNAIIAMKYRQEIDGLRAVAVVPVMLFHSQVAGFAGGFVGVDVFFVISGFLITTILMSDLKNGHFSLLRFYERRARRLLPALILLLLLCLPFAWWWMLPDDLENFGQSVVATVLFSNNILLTLTTGYWDLAAEFKPLLHTWSLAVEEQYYIFFPLLLMLLWRRGRLSITVWLIALFCISFALFLSPYYATLGTKGSAAVFYMLPTRAWEIFLGAIGSIYVARNTTGTGGSCDRTLSLVGLLFVLAGLLIPETWGLAFEARVVVATVGTLLLLVFARGDTLARALLSHRVVVFVGVISYGLYLFHQPLLAFTRIFFASDPGLFFAVSVALTFPLAYASHRFVEIPFRDSARVSTRTAVSIFAVVGIGLLAVGYTFHARDGFPQRLGNAATSADSIAYNQGAYRFKTDQFQGGSRLNVLVLGNSFGRDFVNMLVENTPTGSFNLVYRDDVHDPIFLS